MGTEGDTPRRRITGAAIAGVLVVGSVPTALVLGISTIFAPDEETCANPATPATLDVPAAPTIELTAFSSVYTPSPSNDPNPSIVAIAWEAVTTRQASDRVILALFQAGLAESGFHNLANINVPSSLTIPRDEITSGIAPNGIGQDHRSTGWLQQQNGADGSNAFGWGTVAQTMDPRHAANVFLDSAIRIDRAFSGDSAALAQAVQRSGTASGNNYRRETAEAQAMIAALKTGTYTGAITPASADAPVVSPDETAACIPTEDTTAVVVVAADGAASISGDAALPLPRATIGNLAGVQKPHHDTPGIDLSFPTGTPIYAVVGGTVERAGFGSGFGNHAVYVRDANGYLWRYGHGSALHVTQGQVVTAGTLLADVGSEGFSTGPHLHLDIQNPDGRLVCPQRFLTAVWNQTPPPAVSSLPTTGCTYVGGP